MCVFWPCDFEENSETAKYVSVTPLCDWLHETYGEERMLEMVSIQGDAITRKWFRWRREMIGGVVDVFAVDQFLMDVFGPELMLHELPVEVFSFLKHRRKPSPMRKLNHEQRMEFAKRIVEDGESRQEIAKEVGRSADAVGKWTMRYRQEVLAA